MAGGIIAVKLTWTDTSSGAEDETGQEIDIYTDSASFVPNVPINYSEARHPWMRLPPIAAALEEAIIALKAPVTFVKFRVRQYNAHGNSPWSAFITVPVAQVSGSAVPSAPINLGMVVTGDTPTPPDLPDEDPPDVDPPDTGGGGSSSNYSYAAQFSGVQEQSQWSYRDSSGVLTYDPVNVKWNGDETYLAIWSSGFRYGSSGSFKDAVLRWTAPDNGEANITGSFQAYAVPANVQVKIQHNGVDIFSQTILDGVSYPYDEDVTVSAGDTIDFICRRVSAANYNNNVQLNPNVQLTTDGVTPSNPTISSLTPSTLFITSTGVGSLLVALSSAPTSAATVSVSSSDAAKATVPATVTIPAGQQSANIPVTGVAVGASTITATYSGSSKDAIVTVSSPASVAWSNAPIGGVILLDSNCATKNGMFDVYGTTILDSDATAPFSGPSVWKARMEALTGYGGNQLEYNTPSGVSYREMYFGLYWRSNPQFQGLPVGNKLFFLGSSFGMNGAMTWNNSSLVNGSGPLIWNLNTSGIFNPHIFGGSMDTSLPFFPNVGNGTLTRGVWYKIECYVKASTTRTSRDGILRWWVNDVMVGNYINVNYCGPNGETLTRWMQTQAWDGSGILGSINTVPWEHYIDHLRIVGKN